MKQRTTVYLSSFVSMIALFVLSCSSDKPKDAVKDPASSATATAAKVETKGCCFTKVEDFAPFFPEGNELLTIHGSTELSASFYCGATDDPQKSSANRQYQIDKKGTTDPMQAKYISLQIKDYCSTPDDLAAEITRRTTNSEKAAASNPKITFKRIEKQGVYTGYTWMDSSPGNNASNVDLWVSVDGRFMIHIQGIDHNRMDALNQLFEMIPVDKLAAY